MKVRSLVVFRLALIVAMLVGAFQSVTPAYAASLPAEINKQFSPLQIDAGAVSVMRVTIFNPNIFPLTNASWSDNLVGVQPGLYIANPAGIINTCGGTVTAAPGTTTLSLSGGTVPAQAGPTPGQCYVEVNVSSVTSGNLINTIPANNLISQGDDGGTIVSITNTTPASATITVISVSPPSLSKLFNPTTIFLGQTSQLTIRLNNNDADTNLTGAAYTDTLPAGLVIATPNGLAVTNCGPGTVTAPAGGNTIILINGTVTPAQDCLVTVNVTGASGLYTIANGNPNTIPAGPGTPGSLVTNQGVTNGTPAQADLTIQPVGITKSFAPDPIVAGGTSVLTITLQNPTTSPYTGVTISDVVDNVNPGLEVVPGTEATTCGGVLSTSTTAPGVNPNTITLANGTIPARAAPLPALGTCTVTVTVRAPLTISNVQTVRTNTIPVGALTQVPPGISNVITAQDTLTVNPALTAAKAYAPTNIPVNGLSLVTITLTNNSAIAFTDVDFTDTLPANLSIATTATIPAAPANPTTTCSNGAVPDPTVTNTATAVTLTNGELAANSACTVTFYVTGSVAGSGTTYENTIPVNAISACTAASGCVGNGAIIRTGTDLTIFSSPLPVVVTKAFQTNPIAPGQTSRLRITVTAPADTALSGLTVTDTLPANLVVAAAPVPADTCAGTNVVAPAGGTSISLTGATLGAGASCNIDVYVTSTVPNTYTNSIPASTVTTTEGRTNTAAATATIRVTSLTMTKAFYPTAVQAGGRSTLTITLQNTTDSPINLRVAPAGFTDNLPGNATDGIRVAAIPNAITTCTGGVITATLGSGSITMAGGTIPAQVSGVPGLCTITVDVVGLDSSPATSSTQTNTIPTTNVVGTVQSTGNAISPFAQAQAVLTIQNLSIGVVKGFNPVLVYGGAYSTMSVQLINPNTNTALSGIAFTDNMSLLGAGMQLASPVAFNIGTCGGTLTGNPGDTSFSFSGGVLPANASCTLTLRVVMTVNGNRTNRIPAGAVTTFNGVSNPDPTEASLTNLPGVSVNKTFNPAQVLTNQPSTLTITIRNTSNVPVVDMGVADNLPGTLPDGLEVANPANASTTCGGTLTANPGSQNIQLTGGGLAALGLAGDSCIVIVDVLSTRPGVYLNTIPAGAITASGGVTNNDPASATLTVDAAIFSLGNRVWFDTDNSSAIDGTEVGADGVTVQLYAADAGGNPTGPVLGTSITANGGYYRFDNRAPGNYVVVIPASQFDGGPLTGYRSSGTTLSGAGVINESLAPDPDNDTDSEDNGTWQTSGAFSGAVVSQAVTLGPIASEPVTDADADPTNPAGEAPNAQSNRTVDFGFYRAQLGNLVYADVNTSGTYDAGDTLLAGATVRLFASDGVTEINVGPDGIWGTVDDGTGFVTTGVTGTYQFSGLPQGSYIVRVTPPVGYLSTVDTAVPADTTDPNTNADNNDNGTGTSSGTVSSNVVTLTPGNLGALTNNTVTNATATTYDPTLDFGFTQLLYSLGNRVWFDTDNDSSLNGAEVGVNNVRVELYRDDGATPGVYDAGDTFLSFDATDANGYYRFDNLPTGEYVVLIPSSQFVAGAPLNGYWSSGTTLSNAGVPSDVTANDPDTTVVDSDDNGRATFNGNLVDYVSSAAVTLGTGTAEPTGDNDPVPNPDLGEAPNNQSDRTVDFGFYRGQLGNLIFVDANNNGTYGAGDTPLDGATVQLFAADGTTEIPVGPDGILGTADDGTGPVTTAAAGTYQFSGLPQGSYIVRVTPPVGYTSTVDTADATDTSTPDTNTDNNDNGVGTSSGAVSSNIVTLTPGTTGAQTNNTVTNSTGTTYNPTLDFGFNTPLYSLGNRVWFDTDNDSTINGAEVGVNNVRVELYRDDGATPGVYDAGDTFLSFDTTDANGYYRFDNLPAGDYVVLLPTSQFGAGGVLDGYWSSGTTLSNAGVLTDSAANDPDLDVDDSDDNGVTTFSGNNVNDVSSITVTLGPGTAEPVNDNDPALNPDLGEAPNNQSDRTVDFGFYRTQLGNLVFMDADGSGAFNAADTTLAGATVRLFAADGITEIPVGPDGILGTSDDAAGGVTTGAGGAYQFDGLAQGNYIVRVTPPAGYASTVDTADGTDTTTPNTNTENNDNGIGTSSGAVSSNAVTLTPGNTGAQTNNTVTNTTGTTYDPTVDFGFLPTFYSLGNRVWFDSGAGIGGIPNDGIRNGSEPGINNVTVNLYLDSDDDGTPDGGVIATDTTDANGYYRFDNLAADTYIVEVIPPAGYTSTLDAGDPDTDPDDDDDNGVLVTGTAIRSNPVTLGPGTSEPQGESNPTANPEAGEALDLQSNRTVDFGFVSTVNQVSLGSTVFSDVNGNGVQDTGESGISGVTIELYRSTQTPGVDTPLAFVASDVNGDYFFGGLTPDAYVLYIPIPPASAPLSSSPAVTDTADNSQDGDDNGIQTASGLPVTSPVITLTVDGETTNETFQGGMQDDSDDNNGDMTVDFGFVPASSLVADPAVSKGGSPSRASVGETVIFTLTVTNTGNAPATNVVVNDPVPVMFDVVSVTSVYQAGGNAGTVTITPAGPAPSVTTVSVDLGTLDITDVVVIRITTRVNAFGNPPYSNAATLNTTSPTDRPANNVSGVTIQSRSGSSLPATGFAPKVVTELPAQPRELTYAATDILLEIPSLGIKLPVVGVPKKNGAWDVTWLANQAGWLEGSAFPSWNGNSVLTSHVYLSNGLPGPFVNLNKLKYGDRIIVHAYGEKHIFEVRTNQVVEPNDTTVWKHEEKPWLTLVTCKEYDEKTQTYKKRVAVRAVLVKVEADK